MFAQAGFVVGAVPKAPAHGFRRLGRADADNAPSRRHHSRLQAVASSEVANHFDIEADGSFTIDTILIEVE